MILVRGGFLRAGAREALAGSAELQTGQLLEAKYEAEPALRFLEKGLYRNAAGKAFQAWRALLAALTVDRRDELAGRFSGVPTGMGAESSWRIS